MPADFVVSSRPRRRRHPQVPGARPPAFRVREQPSPRSVASSTQPMFHSTTILAVRHHDRAVLAGDGQVTFGETVVKQRRKKIRRLYNDRILAGFAGSAADSFALFSPLRGEARTVPRATSSGRRSNWPATGAPIACSAASRRCSSSSITKSTFLLSGTGDLIEPDDGIVGDRVGRRLRAGRRAGARAATPRSTRGRSPSEAMAIAADICIYTNANITVEEL